MADLEAIARPYARAVFELARGSDALDAWSGVLGIAAEAAENDDVARLLDTPGVDPEAVASVIAELCRRAVPAANTDEINNFLRLLADNRRVPVLPAIRDRFEALKAEVENVVEVTLLAASQVDDSQRARIADALKKRFGRDVNLHFELDETLIGGARLKANDLVIDGSVRNGLQKLASTLAH